MLDFANMYDTYQSSLADAKASPRMRQAAHERLTRMFNFGVMSVPYIMTANPKVLILWSLL